MKQVELQADGLPATGFLRLVQIIGRQPKDKAENKAEDKTEKDVRQLEPILPLIPVKKSCWWEGVKSGRFPPAVYLGNRLPVWRVEHIRAMIKHGKWSQDLMDEAAENNTAQNSAA